MLKQTLQWWARFHFKLVCKAVTSTSSAYMATAAGELPTDRIVSRGKTLRRRRAQVGGPAVPLLVPAHVSAHCDHIYYRID